MLSDGCEEEIGPVDDELSLEFARLGDLAEAVFSAALAGDSSPTYDSMSRVFRSGYGSVLSSETGHAERRLMIRLWRGEFIPKDDIVVGAQMAEALVRHAQDTLDDGRRAACLERLTKRPALLSLIDEVDVDSAPWREIQRLRRMGRGELEFEQALFDQVSAIGRDEVPEIGAYAAQACALAAAVAEDVEGCVNSFAAAIERAADGGTAPEFIFELLEQRLQLQILLSDRTGARDTLDRIELIEPTMQSPFYRARALFARAAFLQPLDPKRARTDYLEAQRLFSAFGYAGWADRVVADLNR